MRVYGQIGLAIALLVGGALSGCRFDTTGGPAAADDADPTQPDADPTQPDADPTQPDADATQPDAANCGFAFDPVHFSACDDPQPSAGNVSLVGAAFVYDTDTAIFTPPIGGVMSPSHSVVGGVRVIWTDSFVIAATAELRAVGSMPLMIVASGDITIDGLLDVSSDYDGTNFVPGPGADVLATSCMSPPEPGEKCAQHGASGGGGGGFGGAGGQGDHGAADRDGGGCVDGVGPTEGGAAVPMPATIRAGCAGANGSSTDDGAEGDEGLGGPGGGAVHLVSQGRLTIGAVIDAGGAAGGPATAGRASGGGAGSGGYIGLESPDIVLQADAVLAANGGGGGGGCDNAPGTVGQDGRRSATAALGGAGDPAGSDGNDGGFGTTPPEAPDGATADRGGGGGGGSVGYILVHVRGQLTVDPGAESTPPHIEL